MKKIIFSIITVLLFSCSAEEDYIRNIYVNCQIDLSLPEFSKLNTNGNSMFIENHGNKGLIIYSFSNNNYKVYDRNCSFSPSNSCARIDSINSNIAFCGCCPSAFLLDQNGQAVNSPAILPLKKYNYYLEGTLITIYN